MNEKNAANTTNTADTTIISDTSDTADIMKPDVFPSCGYIGAGESGDAVGVMQIMLDALLVRYDGWETLALTCSLDDPTAAAVRAFRAAHALPDAPGVDARTWNEIAGEYAVLREME